MLQLMKDLMLVLPIETVSQSEEDASKVSMQGEAVGVTHEVTHKCKYTGHQGKKIERNKGQQHSKDENYPARKSTRNTCHKV